MEGFARSPLGSTAKCASRPGRQPGRRHPSYLRVLYSLRRFLSANLDRRGETHNLEANRRNDRGECECQSRERKSAKRVSRDTGADYYACDTQFDRLAYEPTEQ